MSHIRKWYTVLADWARTGRAPMIDSSTEHEAPRSDDPNRTIAAQEEKNMTDTQNTAAPAEAKPKVPTPLTVTSKAVGALVDAWFNAHPKAPRGQVATAIRAHALALVEAELTAEKINDLATRAVLG